MWECIIVFNIEIVIIIRQLIRKDPSKMFTIVFHKKIIINKRILGRITNKNSMEMINTLPLPIFYKLTHISILRYIIYISYQYLKNMLDMSCSALDTLWWYSLMMLCDDDDIFGQLYIND